MNKRLKEILEQSELQPYYDAQEGHIEKFAQLIVLECAKICIEQNVSVIDLEVIRQSGKFTLQDIATKSCGENLSKRIKEHFGVK